MKTRLAFLLLTLGLSLAVHAEVFWTGVWYQTKSPGYDRLQGPLEVRLAANGTVQATLIHQYGSSYHGIASESGTWKLKRPHVYQFTFDVDGYRFTGILKNGLMDGRFERLGPRKNEDGQSIFAAGKFQCGRSD